MLKNLLIASLFIFIILTNMSCQPNTNLIYDAEGTQIIIEELVTDGYHIRLRLQIQEETPRIDFDWLRARCDIEILSNERSFRSFRKFGRNTQIVHPEQSMVDLYFTAFVTNKPFQSVMLTNLRIGSIKAAEELELTPKVEKIEFIVPPPEEQGDKVYTMIKLTASKLGFYCDLENPPDRLPIEEVNRTYPVELHFADGSIFTTECNSISNGMETPQSWFIMMRYADYFKSSYLTTEKVDAIEKIIVDGIECVKP